MEENELKEAIASLAKDKANKDALAQMFVEYVQPNHVTTDFVGMLLNTRPLKEGDTLVKKLRKGIRVHTLVPGSIHLKSEVTVSERANYILDGSDVGVTFNQWELESGEIGTVEELRGEMLMKLRDHYQNKVFTALTTIWNATNTPNNYVNSGGTLTDTVLKSAIDYVNNNVGRVRAVVGARSALNAVTTFGGFWKDAAGLSYPVDPQLEEIMRTGWLGSFYGAPIVAINQVWDNPEDYNALIPTDKVLVIGENVGEFITYGEPKYKEWTDMKPTPPQWNLEFWSLHSMIIDKAAGIVAIGGIN
jgi:hypothetical protein